MKLFVVSFLVGSLVLVGTLLAAADQSTSRPGSSVPVRLAVARDSAADREVYSQEAQNQLRQWQRKLRDFGDKAKGGGKAADAAARDELQRAWTNAEAASDRLQAMDAAGWDSAKSSFEKASHQLAESWHRIHPEDQ